MAKVRRRGTGALLGLGALGLVGTLGLRYLWFRQSPLPKEAQLKVLTWRDGTNLAVAHLHRGHERLVIIAHGFLKTMRNPGFVQLANTLGQAFDVLTFDFPGHGLSGGQCSLDFGEAAQVLLDVVDQARALGYEHIALVGFSMGAAAAIIAAAEGAPVEAVVSVSSPVRPARGTGNREHATWSWRWWAKLMGTRLAPKIALRTWPIEYVSQVAPVPLLIVHCQFDIFVRREESEALFALAKPPKDFLYLPWAIHASPRAAARPVLSWLQARMPAL
ncbi:MAG: alpha/beta fold hydrolase [Anaerolineae bacterium]|nr:alpha/beta fold hydrolase [Anaerolineae bacterium]